MRNIVCRTCGENLPETSFYWRFKKRNVRQYSCKECCHNRSRKHYERNQEQVKESTKARKSVVASWFYQYKLTISCSRCEESHPSCLHFHHLDPVNKRKDVSALVRMGARIEIVQEEIAKCIVLCTNCHAKEHWVEDFDRITPYKPRISLQRERTCKVCGGSNDLLQRRRYCLKCWREHQCLYMREYLKKRRQAQL